MIKIGVVGCGEIAQIMHLPNIKSSDLFELHAICDLSSRVVTRVGEIYGVPTEKQFTDFNAMIKDDEIDAYIISTHEHYRPAIAVLNAKKHLLLEKPIAENIAQAKEIVDLAKNNNCILLIGYMKVYDDAFIRLKEIIKDREVKYARIHDFAGSFSYVDEMYDVVRGIDIEDSLKIVNQNIMHEARLEAVGCLNAELIQPYSYMCGISSHDTVLMRQLFGSPTVYDAQYRNGIVSASLAYTNFNCSYESAYFSKLNLWDEKIELYTETEIIELQFPFPYIKNLPTKLIIRSSNPDNNGYSTTEMITSHTESYKNELSHFYDCITNGQHPITSGLDAIEDLVLAADIVKKLSETKQ